MKICIKCNKEKDNDQFYTDPNTRDGLYSYCKSCSNKKTKKWRNKNIHSKVSQSNAHKRWASSLKLETLTYYGPSHTLCCSWPGCFVDDIDCLSLDHINNDGHKEKQRGNIFYCTLRKQKFPKGFQTLCHNHNIKKEIIRQKIERDKRNQLYATKRE
jgi:hypothetical protein